jgi:enoyl-CoA hydratase/carnithine racemase
VTDSQAAGSPAAGEPAAGAQVRLDRRGDVIELVWAAPKLNLFTAAVADEFESALDRVPADGRALIFRAEGRVFCAGVKVQEFTVLDGTAFSRRMLALVQRIESLPMPTIAVVHALNLTIGLELALGCDFIWASEQARMGMVEATVGIAPAAGGTQRLAARAGIGRAAEMVLTGAIYDPADLLSWRVVDRLLPAADLLPLARQFAAELAAGATAASAVSRKILRTARDQGIAAADAITPDLAGPILNGEDAVIGIKSLLDRGRGGPPLFTGR